MVEHYRQAHGIYVASQSVPVTTEDMRRAFVSYRALFSELVYDGQPPAAGAAAIAPQDSFVQ